LAASSGDTRNAARKQVIVMRVVDGQRFRNVPVIL
jgi:hypothetical protein